MYNIKEKSLILIDGFPKYIVDRKEVNEFINIIALEFANNYSLTYHTNIVYGDQSVYVKGYHKYFLVGLNKTLKTLNIINLDKIEELDITKLDTRNRENSLQDNSQYSWSDFMFNPFSWFF